MDLQQVLSPGALPTLKPGKMVQLSSYDTTGGNNDRINLQPGQKATFAEFNGPGVITRIWVTIDSRDPHFLRRILFRFYWDNERHPSVEVPVGDFFGNGFEYTHHTPQYVGMSSGGYYCYFPMPFRENARLEVVNQTGREVYAFYYQVDALLLERPLKEDVAYFHAQWHRDARTTGEENYTVLEATGRGHFVGMNLAAQPYSRSFWYLEGDEMIYVDGEPAPSIHGTGLEDYFTSGWYYKNGTYTAPYHGLVMKDEETKRTVAYRHHVPDPVPFEQSIRVTLEHGHGNEQVVDMASTAFWYQKEPHQPWPPLEQAGLRIPLRQTTQPGGYEAEEASSHATVELEVQQMGAYGAEWSGNAQLRTVGAQAGDSLHIVLDGLEEPAYNARVYMTSGSMYGEGRILVSGELAGRFGMYAEEILPGGFVELENLATTGDSLRLSFVVTGANQAGVGSEIGVDAIVLEPRRQWVPEWLLLGPWPNPRKSDAERYGLDTKYPPEILFDADATFEGVDGQRIAYERYPTPENGHFRLWDKMEPSEFVVSYAVTYVHSPVDTTVSLFLGSDDGAKVLLNGEELYRFLEVRIAGPDQDRIELPLKAGYNELMLKIENNFGGYGFFARILDRHDRLSYDLDPPESEIVPRAEF